MDIIVLVFTSHVVMIEFLRIFKEMTYLNKNTNIIITFITLTHSHKEVNLPILHNLIFKPSILPL